VLTIETKEINISEDLRRKIEMICKFASSKAKFFNGSVRSIKGTNVAYVQPHRIVINNISYLIFDESNKVFVNNLYCEISLSDLEKHIKDNK